jgi:solute carrier family 25, member 33/36
VRALFKGLGPTLSGVVPARYILPLHPLINARAISIYTYSNTKRLLEHNLPTASLTSISVASGILAGVVTSTATNPIWVVKTRLQLDKSITGSRRYINSLDCLAQIWRQEGLKGFSRGLSASYLGVSETTLQWVMYERLKRTFRTENKRPTTFREQLGQALGAGFFAKLIATVVTYPHEVTYPWNYFSNGFLGCEDAITAGSVDGRGSKEEI